MKWIRGKRVTYHLLARNAKIDAGVRVFGAGVRTRPRHQIPVRFFGVPGSVVGGYGDPQRQSCD